jgi:uncharacterized membrane protein
MLYFGFKLFHIIAVVLFLGNIITGLFWKAHADRTRDPRVIVHTFEGIIRSDRWFTIPGVIAITVGGLGTAILGGIPILRTGWILWAIVLFSLSGLAFSFRVAPLQTQLAAFAHAGAESGHLDWARYHAVSRRWELWGLFALLTPMVAVALMVFKPALPAF